MMPAAHGQAVLIRKRGQIVRMRSVHYKSNQCAALRARAKNACARQGSETLSRIARQLRIVFENR